MFGGVYNKVFSNALYVINGAEPQEKVASHGWEPVGRAGHGSVMINDKLFIHGGYDGQRARADFLVFDFGEVLTLSCVSDAVSSIEAMGKDQGARKARTQIQS